MVATAFDEENAVFEKPPDMMADECDALSVWRGAIGSHDGPQVVISCWKPTKEELEEINRTGRVWVIVLGQSMPPICPTGTNPFK